MIEVKRKTSESVSSFLRRFSRRVMQSGMILRIRKKKFYKKPLNKRRQKSAAIYRAGVKEGIEIKKKMNKPK